MLLRSCALMLMVLLGSCPEPVDEPIECPFGVCGKADGQGFNRQFEVIFTAPFCEECTSAEKTALLERSRIIQRVVSLIDSAQSFVHVAQFTFSRKEIEAALIAAHQRGVDVRVAMDSKQDREGSVARRLGEAGVSVRYIQGKEVNAERFGLMHAKFMLVDDAFLLTGSNNWSSTGVSINDENTMVIESTPDDPLLSGFRCHFEAIWNANIEGAGACSSAGVAFSPSTAGLGLLKQSIRDASESVDVLMHHLTFSDLTKELAKAQERGVSVRLVVNEGDRAEHTGGSFVRLIEAGAKIRFRRTNEEAFQFMHHKLAIIDGKILINGSGNWSGSGFFNNYENYLRFTEPQVVAAFVSEFERLYTMALSEEALDGGWTAAEQDQRVARPYFGTLHAHVFAKDADGTLLDDGNPEREDETGTLVSVDMPSDVTGAFRFAYEYARDDAELDFMALSPHTTDLVPNPTPDANMTEEGFEQVLAVSRAITEESEKSFVAIPSMEWSTNSTGNHLGVMGAEAIAKSVRGDFRDFYDGFVSSRVRQGDLPVVMMNHPRTFGEEGQLKGSWDQIYGRSLLDIEKESDRRKKFNDYGLDDYPPMSDVHEAWVAGTDMPSESVVAETLANMEERFAPFNHLMEVTLNRGKDLRSETAKNPSLVTDDQGAEVRRTGVHTDWDYYLSHGFKLAPAASHDCHYANWGQGNTGRTAIYSGELSEARLLSAIRRRAVYASEDQNLELRFFMDGRHQMGAVTQTLSDFLAAQIYVADPDSQGPFMVRVFSGKLDGVAPQVVAEFEHVGAWEEIELDVQSGSQYFYLEVHDTGKNRMAWSAPIWVDGWR